MSYLATPKMMVFADYFWRKLLKSRSVRFLSQINLYYSTNLSILLSHTCPTRQKEATAVASSFPQISISPARLRMARIVFSNS